MKFRKKPVVVEAIQLTYSSIADVYRFIYGSDSVTLDHSRAKDAWEDYEQAVKRDGLKLKTLESDGETQTASIGDWIIKGIHGEFYPCKPDVFEKTYEPVYENPQLLQP